MVYQSWRQGVEVEVAHAVRADNHGCLLVVEGIYDLLESLRRRIEVVAVQLYGKLSAELAVDGYIPAAADAEVGSLRHNLYQSFLASISRDFIEYLASAVGRMVVDHDDVVLEIGLLAQRTLHGIGDGLLAVEHGNDDRSLVVEILFAEVGLAVEGGVDRGLPPCSRCCVQAFSISICTSAVARVHIVELLLAALSGVEFDLLYRGIR